MPIVAGVGGNAGTQTLAVTVRALATNQLTGSNRWRAVGREIRIALLNGLTIAVLIGVGVAAGARQPGARRGDRRGDADQHHHRRARRRARAADARAGRRRPGGRLSVFVTMITDSMGFLAFLGLATAAGLGPLSALQIMDRCAPSPGACRIST